MTLSLFKDCKLNVREHFTSNTPVCVPRQSKGSSEKSRKALIVLRFRKSWNMAGRS